MRRFSVLLASLVLALLMLGMLVGSLAAQTTSQEPAPPVYAACQESEDEIVAADIPKDSEDDAGERDVSPEQCPIEGRPITDGVVGSVVPAEGDFVYAEALQEDGAQELEVTHETDGTIELQSVGEEPLAAEIDPIETDGTSPGECSDPGPVRDTGYRLWSTLGWYFNRSTTPTELTPDAAEIAMIAGGANIYLENNICGYPDVVDPILTYQGNTSSGAGISNAGGCLGASGTSVVAFGDLPVGNNGPIVGTACIYGFTDPGQNTGQILESDIKINSVEASWTTADPATCQANTPNRWQIEAVMTHERGHTYGMKHAAPEEEHKFLTMSPTLNARCKAPEATLGRGDHLLLREKYGG